MEIHLLRVPELVMQETHKVQVEQEYLNLNTGMDTTGNAKMPIISTWWVLTQPPLALGTPLLLVLYWLI